jgi:hypothetical protein
MSGMGDEMLDTNQVDPGSGAADSPGRGRQIVLIFLVIGVITIAFMQFHGLVPGMDQLVAVTPIVLGLVVLATVWILYRTVRRR